MQTPDCRGTSHGGQSGKGALYCHIPARGPSTVMISSGTEPPSVTSRLQRWSSVLQLHAGVGGRVDRHAYTGVGSTAIAMASDAADDTSSTSSKILSKPSIPSWGSCPPDFARSDTSGGGAGISLMGFPSR